MERTQKWHILAILESGKLMSFNLIRIRLEKDFSLKPKPEALWKMLQRCSCSSRGQGLISIEKIRRNNFYRITEKGRKRRTIVAERKWRVPRSVRPHFQRG
jgi:DNA-binding PadR family transcriptional regulator